MSIQKTITLTDKGGKAGPTFNVYYSINGTLYVFLETVLLEAIGSYVIVTLPNNARAIKLVSMGDCTNDVIHGIPGASLGDFSPLDFDILDFN